MKFHFYSFSRLKLALRKLLHERILPSEALFFYPEEIMTGIGPAKIILQKITLLLEGLLTGKEKEWKLKSSP